MNPGQAGFWLPTRSLTFPTELQRFTLPRPAPGKFFDPFLDIGGIGIGDRSFAPNQLHGFFWAVAARD